MKIKVCLETSLVFAALFLCSCSRDVGQSSTKPAEEWAVRAHSDWPQIVLTNSASFEGHSELNGASCFLVRTSTGQVMGATALHLIGENGGVEPELRPRDFKQALVRWIMHPRTKPECFVQIAKKDALFEIGKDWLIIQLEHSNASLPAVPLRIRSTPVIVGETVHVVGVSYDEPDVVQKVYSGKVTQRAHGDRFRFDITPSVNIRGFSGAPIVDDNGLLVGVTTIWFKPRMNGEMWLESGGEDASTADRILAR